MIASLTGILTSIGKSEIIIEVNGVGYLLNVTSKLISTLGEIGSTLSVFNSFNFSINLKIEFKSSASFSAFVSSTDILDNLDICFIVLRSIVI